jgi:hypothetical protein
LYADDENEDLVEVFDGPYIEFNLEDKIILGALSWKRTA